MKATLLVNGKWATVKCRTLPDIDCAVIVTIERNYRRIYDAKTGQPLSGEFHKDYLNEEIECIKTIINS
jgi:hypothetical protein